MTICYDKWQSFFIAKGFDEEVDFTMESASKLSNIRNLKWIRLGRVNSGQKFSPAKQPSETTIANIAALEATYYPGLNIIDSENFDRRVAKM